MRDDFTCGHLQMTNTRDDSTQRHHVDYIPKIRLTIYFVVEDGEALCSQQKQYLELTVV